MSSSMNVIFLSFSLSFAAAAFAVNWENFP